MSESEDSGAGGVSDSGAGVGGVVGGGRGISGRREGEGGEGEGDGEGGSGEEEEEQPAVAAARGLGGVSSEPFISANQETGRRGVTQTTAESNMAAAL